ncbi:unnamed protein product [Notodromas monacha]|uniref:Methyltransferase FkbM domain-containing protein n=1 Tax=Notodromas monacha TaxID=399045 RepID=A0A7R9GIZ0_9CRUS|nr:unnamed protein product [Notodromas monacha]CAG0923092.1 unnamed protein product [Notodromas monacha]
MRRNGQRKTAVFTALFLFLAFAMLSFLYYSPKEFTHSFLVNNTNVSSPPAGEVSISTKIPGFEKPFGESPEEDQRLLEHLQKSVLWPPSKEDYNLLQPNAAGNSEGGFITKHVIPKYFPNVTNGVFFEAGALDGETLSTTLYLERFKNWTGLISEMNPLGVDRIVQKKRKCWLAPACLSPTNTPSRMVMHSRYDPAHFYTTWGGTVSEKNKVKRGNPDTKKATELEIHAIVPCYPLTAILIAANVTSIDFFSLDLEGLELKVLKTINWDLINIKVIHMDLLHTDEGEDAVHTFLQSKGYKHVHGRGEPVLFVQEKFLNSLN